MALVVGAGLGLLFAVLGAGGGSVAVPVLVLAFGVPLPVAAGASLLLIAVASTTASVGYARARAVHWPKVARLGPAALLGTVIGGRLNPLVPPRLAAAALAVVLVLAVVALMLPARARTSTAPRTGPALLLGGSLIGVLTGLLGVGGGFLWVPLLTSWMGLALAEAVATSTALIALSSAAGALLALGHQPALWSFAGPIAAGAAVGALLGVPLAKRTPVPVRRIGFAVLALGVAGSMALEALR